METLAARFELTVEEVSGEPESVVFKLPRVLADQPA
jgi:hypothetical protein